VYVCGGQTNNGRGVYVVYECMCVYICVRANGCVCLWWLCATINLSLFICTFETVFLLFAWWLFASQCSVLGLCS